MFAGVHAVGRGGAVAAVTPQTAATACAGVTAVTARSAGAADGDTNAAVAAGPANAAGAAESAVATDPTGAVTADRLRRCGPADHIGFCLGVWAVKPRDASVAAASPGPPRGAVTTDTTRATGATVAAITE